MRAHETYRFVVTYRREPREIRGAREEWRGTVQRVPDALEQLARPGREVSMSFTELGEIPDIIRSLVEKARGERRRGSG